MSPLYLDLRMSTLAGCPAGYYGIDCRQTCSCHDNDTCDAVTGQCACPAGWIGAECRVRCPSGFHGHNCSVPCRCQHGSACDHVTGQCTCPKGYTGPQCEQSKYLLEYNIPLNMHEIRQIIMQNKNNQSVLMQVCIDNG